MSDQLAHYFDVSYPELNITADNPAIEFHARQIIGAAREDRERVYHKAIATLDEYFKGKMREIEDGE